MIDVGDWPIAAFAALQNSGRYWSNNGHWPELARNGSVANDLACVKTHCFI